MNALRTVSKGFQTKIHFFAGEGQVQLWCLLGVGSKEREITFLRADEVDLKLLHCLCTVGAWNGSNNRSCWSFNTTFLFLLLSLTAVDISYFCVRECKILSVWFCERRRLKKQTIIF